MKYNLVRFAVALSLAANMTLAAVSTANAEENDDGRAKQLKQLEELLEKFRELQTRLAPPPPPKGTVDLEFKNYTQAGLPEQDVFLHFPTLAIGQVMRPEKVTGIERAYQAYAVKTALPHDPYKIGSNPLGPYEQGSDLSFTLGAWLDAKVKGTYRKTGDDEAELKLTMEKLMRNGLYTILCSRSVLPPNFSEVNKPCGKEDGSESIVRTNADGDATFTMKLKPLPGSTYDVKTVIALAYHSDGAAHGASPGELGLNSHIQLFATLPVSEEDVKKATPSDQLKCMQTANEKRDNAMLAAFDAYSVAAKNLLTARRESLKTAWTKNDDKERVRTLRAAWNDYRDGLKIASRKMRDARVDAWRAYRDDRKACGFKGKDPLEGEGHDEKLAG